MPRNDNPHSLRMCRALCHLGNSKLAEHFAEVNPLSRSASVEQKIRWACTCCDFLNEHCSLEEAILIRRTCRCKDGVTMANAILAAIRKTGSLSTACELFTQQNKYAFLEYVNAHELVFGYHACVCSCVKRSNQPVPRLWCECSVGYAESMFRHIVGKDVSIMLLESVKTGGKCCKMRITWQ